MGSIQVRYIPIINKWEVVSIKENTVVLIGRYSEHKVAQEVASMALKGKKNHTKSLYPN